MNGLQVLDCKNNNMLKSVRTVIDILMILLMPLLMAYSLVGETLHEIIGTAIFVLFITHHVINRKWYSALNKGRYNAQRIIRTVLDLLLFVFMILQPVSGMLISKHLYTFIPVLPVTSLMRTIHLIGSYWGFVLLSFHAGIHLKPLVNKVCVNKAARIIFIVVSLIISLFGCYVFYKRGFAGYMTGKNAFFFIDLNESRILFYLEHLAVMILFETVGYMVFNLLFGTKEDKKCIG